AVGRSGRDVNDPSTSRAGPPPARASVERRTKPVVHEHNSEVDLRIGGASCGKLRTARGGVRRQGRASRSAAASVGRGRPPGPYRRTGAPPLHEKVVRPKRTRKERSGPAPC